MGWFVGDHGHGNSGSAACFLATNVPTVSAMPYGSI